MPLLTYFDHASFDLLWQCLFVGHVLAVVVLRLEIPAAERTLLVTRVHLGVIGFLVRFDDRIVRFRKTGKMRRIYKYFRSILVQYHVINTDAYKINFNSL